MALAHSIVIDNIGSLITNDPTIGEGPLGILTDACVVVTDGEVEFVGAAGATADDHIDAEGLRLGHNTLWNSAKSGQT